METQPAELIETMLEAALAAITNDEMSTISAISVGVEVAQATHRPTTEDLTTAKKNVEGLIFARGGYTITAALSPSIRKETIRQTIDQIREVREASPCDSDEQPSHSDSD